MSVSPVRQALRRLRFERTLSLAIVATFALGMGASTVVLSVGRAVFFTAVPYAAADRLVVLTPSHEGQGLTNGQGSLSYVEFRDWKLRLAGVDMAAFHSGSTGISLNLTSAAEPERVHVNFVSAGYFDVLGVSAAVGRTFASDEGLTRGDSMVAVISDGLWRQRFGGDEAIAGTIIRLDGKPLSVIGVAPPGFQPLAYEREADLWVPVPAVASLVNPFYADDRRARWLGAVARLPDGETLSSLRGELEGLALSLQHEHPELNDGWRIEAVPVAEHLLGYGVLERSVAVLGGAAAFLLAIGVINVATLMVIRARSRRAEFAVRSAVGAGAGSLVRQLVAESLILSALGGAFGVLAALWFTGALVAWSPLPLPDYIVVRLDPAVLAVAALTAVAVGIIAGVGPATVAVRSVGTGGLREGSRYGESRSSRRWRESLAALQVAAAALLLVGAGLLAASYWRLHTAEPGYRTRGLLAGELQLGVQAYATPDTRRAFYARLLEVVKALPGVDDAALWAASLPGDNWRYWEIVPEGRGGELPEDRIVTFVHRVSPGALDVLGLPILRGRGIGAGDVADTRGVAVVSESFAHLAWPGEDALGKRYRVHTSANPDEWVEVVGVAADAYQRGRSERGSSLVDSYYPLQQRTTSQIGVLARTSDDDDAARLAPSLRRAVATIDRTLPLFNLETMSSRRLAEEHGSRFQAALVAAMAIAAAALAAVGVYGVAAESAQQRSRELGVRRALGARDSDLLWVLLVRPLLPALSGLAVGAATAGLLSPLLETLLFGASPLDAGVYIGSALLLAATVVLACWLPARRSLRPDPLAILRGSD